jgi:hypothetical protein
MDTNFDTAKGDDLETIRHRLADAVAWFGSASRLPDNGFPRSGMLSPSHLQSNRKLVVRSVADDRRRAVKANPATTAGRIEGRLLGYGPDETVWDGASEAATMGFFDEVDEPPWDLWLGYVVETSGRSYLVSWIPPTLVGTAEDGINVNPVACLFWLDEFEQALGLRLKDSA